MVKAWHEAATETPERHVLHLDLDTFFVSVERLQDSRLQGKPIIIGSTSNRGVVASCSYEARSFGVHSAMPMRLARQLCPQATYLRGDTGLYTRYSDTVTQIIREKAPTYEKSSVDEFYLDISGMDRFFGCYQWSLELKKAITHETGLPISFALAGNKTVAKVGTGEAKPNGQMQVRRGTEKGFLAPLPVRKLPMAGEKTCQLLHSMGIQYIRTLQALAPELMERALGLNGLHLWKKAQGIDNSPVIPYREKKSISTERTFERDTMDMDKLKCLLIAMVESLAYQLRNGNKLTACVSVKIRYADFQTHSIQKRLPYTSCDHTLMEVATELFHKLYQRRQRIRLLGVECSHLVEGHYQIGLFEQNQRMLRLYQAMDRMRDRFGYRAVKRAAGMQARSIGGWSAFNGEPPVLMANRKA